MQSSTTSVESAETAKTTQETTRADVDLALSDIAVAKASINDAKAQLQLETATLDFHTLTAPYDAMVTARLKELGAAMGAGEPVFTLIDPKSVWALAFIDESKSGEIKVGETAEIVLRSLPGKKFAGKVARIEPESDRVNEERRIAIAFDSIPGRFPSRRTGRNLYYDEAIAAGFAGAGSGDRRLGEKPRHGLDRRRRSSATA